MINKISYIETSCTNPHENLALEEELLYYVGEDECILYLWQNSHTVVIGKNQNAWKECNVEKLQAADGLVARRTTGGGAVYHDLGNLNFTFLVKTENYDLNRQMDVILKAIQSLGIEAEKSGRNDITVKGKKVSGNAFLDSQGCSCHHGTLMVNVDKDRLMEYLNVSQDKLDSKGVDSVKSRVGNLMEFNPDLTIDVLKEALVEAFEEVYKGKAEPLSVNDLDSESLNNRIAKLSSWEWIYGRKIPFSSRLYKRFEWGDFDLHLEVNGGVIVDARVYSDSMEAGIIEQIGPRLKGIKYNARSIVDALGGIGNSRSGDAMGVNDSEKLNDSEKKILNDIIEYIADEV